MLHEKFDKVDGVLQPKPGASPSRKETLQAMWAAEVDNLSRDDSSALGLMSEAESRKTRAKLSADQRQRLHTLLPQLRAAAVAQRLAYLGFAKRIEAWQD